MMTVVEFAHGSAGYLEVVRLRDLHLRQPIGLRLRDEERLGEESHRHFALVENERIVGGLIANPLEAEAVKLRQMWIDPALRGRGLGRELLEGVEKLLAAEGVRHFTLHARESAAGFYRTCGYRAVGETFTEVGMPHVRMEKRLTA